MNDEQFIEAARHLAQRVLKAEADDAKRLDVLGLRLLSRTFEQRELAIIQESLRELSAFYKANPEEAKQLIEGGESPADSSLNPETLAAWTMLANELMNLDEVLNK